MPWYAQYFYIVILEKSYNSSTFLMELFMIYGHTAHFKYANQGNFNSLVQISA